MLWIILPLRNLFLGIAATVLVTNAFSTSFQIEPDDTRGLKPREYARRIQDQIAKKRPRSTRPKPTAVVTYTPLTKGLAPVAAGVNVGVTIWRLRPALKQDASDVQEPTRIVVRKKNRSENKILMMTPTRAESGTQFADGDLLKFTVEPPFEAYIYILNREQYADGTMSDPYLIFPSREDVGTNDKGMPGRLLFLPSAKADDKFEVRRLSDLNHTEAANAQKTAEVFTVIFSRQPIKELSPLEKSDEPRKVAKQQLERWHGEWGGPVWRFEQQGSAGASITKVEKQAGKQGGDYLDDADPKPQTVYHIAGRAADALVFDVSIEIRK